MQVYQIQLSGQQMAKLQIALVTAANAERSLYAALSNPSAKECALKIAVEYTDLRQYLAENSVIVDIDDNSGPTPKE